MRDLRAAALGLWILSVGSLSLGLWGCGGPEPGVRDVTQQEVLGFTDDSPLLVDVRTRLEYAEGHVPGAINVPHEEVAERLDDFGDPGREIVVYCKSGRRAGLAAEVLRGAGHRVGHLTGDMEGWRAAGHAVETGEDDH